MNILITDDEKFVRKSIKTIFLRMGIDESNIFEASNGQEMIDALNLNDIDVAFVDVKMPIKSGLSATKVATSISPNTVIYILSGYADFTYAQKALSLGVSEYFLKPLTPKDAQNALDKAKGIQEKRILVNTVSLEKNVRNILRGDTNLYIEYFAPVIVYTNEDYSCEHIQEKLSGSFKNIDIVAISENDNLFVLHSNREEILKNILKELSSVSEDLYFYHTGLCNSLNLNAKIKEVYMVFRTNFSISPEKVNTKANNSVSHELEEAFYQTHLAYMDKNSSKYRNELSNFISLLRHEASSINFVKLKAGLSFYFNVDFSKAKDIDDISNIFNKLALTFEKVNEPTSFNIVEKVLEDMEINFSSDLSINRYADKFGISPNYLSSKFSTEVDQSFVKRLIHIRINHAKQLLTTTDLPINKISNVCGYYSTSYFSKAFYKLTNKTPNEYRSDIFKEI